MPAYYPLHLSIAGKKCLVVGGGRTAERKVKTLLHFGGRVVVVSPEATPAIRTLSRGRKFFGERGSSEHLTAQAHFSFLRPPTVLQSTTESPGWGRKNSFRSM